MKCVTGEIFSDFTVPRGGPCTCVLLRLLDKIRSRWTLFRFFFGGGGLVRVNLSEGHTWLLLPTVHARQEWDAVVTLALQSCAMDSFSRDSVDIRSMNVSIICLL